MVVVSGKTDWIPLWYIFPTVLDADADPRLQIIAVAAPNPASCPCDHLPPQYMVEVNLLQVRFFSWTFQILISVTCMDEYRDASFLFTGDGGARNCTRTKICIFFTTVNLVQ